MRHSIAKYSSNSVVQPSRVMHAGQATRAVYGLGVVTTVSCSAQRAKYTSEKVG